MPFERSDGALNGDDYEKSRLRGKLYNFAVFILLPILWLGIGGRIRAELKLLNEFPLWACNLQCRVPSGSDCEGNTTFESVKWLRQLCIWRGHELRLCEVAKKCQDAVRWLSEVSTCLSC